MRPCCRSRGGPSLPPELLSAPITATPKRGKSSSETRAASWSPFRQTQVESSTRTTTSTDHELAGTIFGATNRVLKAEGNTTPIRPRAPVPPGAPPAALWSASAGFAGRNAFPQFGLPGGSVLSQYSARATSFFLRSSASSRRLDSLNKCSIPSAVLNLSFGIQAQQGMSSSGFSLSQ